MLKLQLYTISKNDIMDLVKILQHPNKIFKFENGINKIYRNGSYQPFKIQITPYDKDKLSYLIKQIVLASHNQVKDWKIDEGATKEQFDFVSGYSEKTIEKDIDLWLYWLESNKKLDVINVCCFIPLKLLTTKHYWENGNKRTSITTLMNLLDAFRFFLSFTSLEPKEIKMRWYDVFLNYLERSKRNMSGVKENPEKIYQDFYNEVFRAIFINGKYII